MVSKNRAKATSGYALCSLMHLTIFTIALFPVFVNAQPPESCQCLWQGSFNAIVKHSDFIASGEVITTKGNSIEGGTSEVQLNVIAKNILGLG